MSNTLVQIGNEFKTSISLASSSGNPIIDDFVIAIIKNLSNNKYFNGLFWTEQECNIAVAHSENGVYELTFTPTELSSFEITIKSEKYSVSETDVIYSFEEGCEDSPVNINNTNFFNQDSTDTQVLDANNNPVKGAAVSCYNLKGEVVAVTQTNDLGEWNLLIRRGSYFFTFEKEGYISVSFERTVV